jgi:hypothetical protein
MPAMPAMDYLLLHQKQKFRFVFCHDPFAFSLVPKTLIATPTSGRFVEALRM